jgi:hypothetical protein
MFNPHLDIPSTDEEVKVALRYRRDDLTGRNLVGIFECRRTLGDDLLLAYERALLAHLDAVNAGDPP